MCSGILLRERGKKKKRELRYINQEACLQETSIFEKLQNIKMVASIVSVASSTQEQDGFTKKCINGLDFCHPVHSSRREKISLTFSSMCPGLGNSGISKQRVSLMQTQKLKLRQSILLPSDQCGSIIFGLGIVSGLSWLQDPIKKKKGPARDPSNWVMSFEAWSTHLCL